MATNTQSTLRLQSGATVSSSVNPTGATVTRKSASQAPTVVIQATGSGGSVFNYKDDCYIFDGVGIAEAASYSPSSKRIGAGKVVGNLFTGLMGVMSKINGSYVLSVLSGSSLSMEKNARFIDGIANCNNSSCWYYSLYEGIYNNGIGYPTLVVMASSLPVANVQKCYP